jgi:cytochrome c oxidase accessory protein FixG
MTGGAWVFYFHDAPSLMGQLFAGAAPLGVYLWIGILTFTTYALAGGMREQVCTYMCPWPRIQGAMLDDQSMQVTYRADRGEVRGAHKKGASWAGRGDCVDCQQCVVVCPMGIDIRDGAQLECINCALCIDACDAIMDKVERPRGLIAFDTDAAVLARRAGQRPRYRLVRTRTIYYGLALAVVGSIMLYGLMTRPAAALDVIRDRNPTFVTLSDGSVRNGYTLKIMNRSDAPMAYRIEFAGPAGARLTSVGAKRNGADVLTNLDPDGQVAMQVFVTVAADASRPQSEPASFRLAPVSGGKPTLAKTVFLSGDEGQ